MFTGGAEGSGTPNASGDTQTPSMLQNRLKSRVELHTTSACSSSKHTRYQLNAYLGK